MTVPGIGPIISTATAAAIGSGDAFSKGRDFGAWLGLVPRQMSTGGRTIVGPISKRGNRYLRMLFVQAARAVLLRPLRFYARFYIHDHRVGGTNPSLVEALGAGSPIIAHDNPFNRWVAGLRAAYFCNEMDLMNACAEFLQAPTERLDELSAASRARHAGQNSQNMKSLIQQGPTA